MNSLEEAKRISERITMAESDLSDSETASLVIGLALISIAEDLRWIELHLQRMSGGNLLNG